MPGPLGREKGAKGTEILDALTVCQANTYIFHLHLKIILGGG
jgi:hypothetical protein